VHECRKLLSIELSSARVGLDEKGEEVERERQSFIERGEGGVGSPVLLLPSPLGSGLQGLSTCTCTCGGNVLLSHSVLNFACLPTCLVLPFSKLYRRAAGGETEVTVLLPACLTG